MRLKLLYWILFVSELLYSCQAFFNTSSIISFLEGEKLKSLLTAMNKKIEESKSVDFKKFSLFLETELFF